MHQDRDVEFGTSSSRCDIVVRNGGVLAFDRCRVHVHGDVWLERDGILQLVDSYMEVVAASSRRYSYHLVGGWLDTRRSVLGGQRDVVTGASVTASVNHFYGLWTARETGMHFTSLLLGLAGGSNLHPDWLGGRFWARGFHAGPAADSLIAWGAADARVEDATIPLSLRIPGIGGLAQVDLESRVRFSAVYGDPAVHNQPGQAPVTHPIPGSLARVEVQNHLSPNWQVMIDSRNVQPAPTTVELTNSSAARIYVVTDQLQNRPVRVGPWSTFYPPGSILPELPSFRAPGFHAIPPGCGIQLGNVTVQSPSGSASDPDNWAKVLSWAFSLRSPSCSFSILGPTYVGEVVLDDGARFDVQGGEGYDALVQASLVTLTRGSGNPAQPDFLLRDVHLGLTATRAGIIAHGQSVAEVDGAVTTNLELTTRPEILGTQIGLDAGRITARNLFETTPTRVFQSPGGTVDIERALPSQATDRQNLDLDEGVLGSGLPEYWTGTGVTTSSSNSVRAAAAQGTSCVVVDALAGSGEFRKELRVPVGAIVSMHAFLDVQAIAAGAEVFAVVRGNAGGAPAARSRLLRTPQGWGFVHTEPYVVTAPDTGVQCAIRYTNAPANGGGTRFAVDDCDVRIATWWTNDNLANLGFEDPEMRWLYGNVYGPQLTDSNDVPYWRLLGCLGVRDTTVVAPGAGSTASMRCTETTGSMQLFKDLTFLEPGMTVTWSGMAMARPDPTQQTYINVWAGEVGTWTNTNYGNNRHVQLQANNQWHAFSVTYTVPAAGLKRSSTRFVVTGGGSSNDRIWLDDMEFDIR